MAEECVSVTFEDGSTWQYCWEDATPYPGFDAGNVTTGLRTGPDAQGRAWRSCQYFLKGLPSVCKWFVEGSPGGGSNGESGGEGEEGETSYYCSYVNENSSDNPLDPKIVEPSGYNFAQCDFLGRRSWCDRYVPSEAYDPDKWICTAPNPFLTKLGRASHDAKGQVVSFRSISRNEIGGYNDNGAGVGRCDCAGFGRGEKGCKFVGDDFSGKTTKEMEINLNKLPIVCNYYRPFSMGFGIVKPSQALPGDVSDDRITITQEGWERAETWEKAGYDEKTRLPLNYQIYNCRAQYQKCQWWEEEKGRSFYVKDGQIFLTGDTGYGEPFDNYGKVEFCKCPHANAERYNTRILEAGDTWPTGEQWALTDVWAKGGMGPVCNGANPACPCYTGKWEFLTQEKMWPGMPMTASQLLELRFWEQDWDSQEDYDDYYSIKPNFDDPPDPGIFTFIKWVKDEETGDGDALAGIDITKSKMLGRRLTICQPAPLNQKEFTREYIQSEDVEYYHGNIGTSSSDQRHYPSLIREISCFDVNPLVVVYPPPNDTPFSSAVCVKDDGHGYTKRSSDMRGDYIKTIGQTLINKRVYTINTDEIPFPIWIRNFNGINTIKGKRVELKDPEVIKDDIYNAIRRAISTGMNEYPEYIKFSTSDKKFGYFAIDAVRLNYSKDNYLLICVDLGDGTWEFRWRKVVSRWYGGVIKQTDYRHTYGNDSAGYTNEQPSNIIGLTGLDESSAKASLVGLGGCTGLTDVEVVSTFSLDDPRHGRTLYDYTFEKIANFEIEQDLWGAVGNSNKIIAAINDININYIYDWTVENPYLERIKPEEDDSESEEAKEPPIIPDVVELNILFMDDNYLGANYCVFEPKDENIRTRFWNSEWKLILDYGYVKLTNSPAEGSELIAGGDSGENKVLVHTPHNVSGGGTSVSVTQINDGTVGLMAHFKDENGRIISAFATKLLVQIINESCRNVDIFYKYSAMGRYYYLIPFTGFCTKIKNDQPGGQNKHVEIPNCGDHEHSWTIWEGPMWFPFDVCRGYDMYDEWTHCNNCQAAYWGPENEGFTGEFVGGGKNIVPVRKDYRYCGPYKYDAFGFFRVALGSCSCGCSFYYSDASDADVVFEGRARIKTTVDLAEYAEFGWYPPPFGNIGREALEKYLSHDYIAHLIPFIKDGVPQLTDWMPLMLDHSGFFATFNAYDGDTENTWKVNPQPGNEPFRYVYQSTMGISPAINEEIDDGSRYRWEDVFEVHHEGNCSYPTPAYPITSVATKAVFYYLKFPWAAWAWQEAWKDIERNYDTGEPTIPADAAFEEGETVDVGKLNFVDIQKPKYITDYYKTEHRVITDEGVHTIIFKGPEEDVEGNITGFASLSIDGNNPRYFQIFYPEDTYTSDHDVEWQDEGGGGAVQGSSDEDNIYEEAKGGAWIHEEGHNMLFDGEAVSDTSDAEDAGRQLIAGPTGFFGEDYEYYNRGLIAKITRDRLYSLPKDEWPLEVEISEEDSTPQYDGDIEFPGDMVWQGDASVVINLEEPTAIANITIKGWWGTFITVDPDSEETAKQIEIIVIKPGLSISCTFEDGTTGVPNGFSSAGGSKVVPIEGSPMQFYNFDLDFALGPIEMLKKRTTKITISLSGDTIGFLNLSAIELTAAEYINEMYEDIYVWERKYIISHMDDITNNGINLDGPGDHLHYQQDLLNMGQYFDFRGSRFRNSEYAAMDKTKVIACGVHHPEDVEILGVDMSTLHDIEVNEQLDLYEYTFGLDPTGTDFMAFTGITPFKFADFLNEMGQNFPTNALVIYSEKLPFSKHMLYKQYYPYSFWRPGGHKYEWNTETVTRQRCWLFSAPENFYQGKYLHVDHRGIGTPLEVRPDVPIDAAYVLYSQRLYIQQAKYDRAMILAGGAPEYTDKWGIGGSTIAGTAIR